MKKTIEFNKEIIEDLLVSILKNNNCKYGKYSMLYNGVKAMSINYDKDSLTYSSKYNPEEIILSLATLHDDIVIKLEEKIEYLYIDYDARNDRFVIKQGDNFSPEYEKNLRIHNVFPTSKYKKESLENIMRSKFAQAVSNILKENIA